MNIELIENDIARAKIRVIGVGGGGGNAVNNMIMSGMSGVDFAVVNTDSQDLGRSLAPTRFQLGSSITRGLGAGAKPDIGREAALEDRDRIAEMVIGCDMVFITAGMGGGTGTGAAPVIAQIAKEAGVLTVGVVTRPFLFEGKRRRNQADQGIENLKQCVDTLITIPNQRLINMSDERTTMIDSFKIADRVLLQAVRGVSDLINFQGFVNVDFADVRTVMEGQGVALMGVGLGTGKRRVVDAAQQAISSPLLDDVGISGAKSLLINVTGNSDLLMHEISEASSLISEEAHEDANVIWGWVIDETMKDEARVTVIATGFVENQIQNQPALERRVANVTQGHRSNYRGNTSRPSLVSGLGTGDDYDLPTFYRK
jgi:cell division protein FtsZ